MRITPTPYPRVRDAMKWIAEIAKERGQPTDIRSLAAYLGIATASLQAWQHGVREPREATIERIASKLFPDASQVDKRLDVKTRFLEVETLAPSIDTPVGRSIGIIEYGVFSKPAYCPFWPFLARLEGPLDQPFGDDVTRITPGVGDTPSWHDRDLEALLDRFDLLVNLLDCPSRHRFAYFLPSPIQIGVNAIVSTKLLTLRGLRADQVRSRLFEEDDLHEFQLTTMRGEAGDEYGSRTRILRRHRPNVLEDALSIGGLLEVLTTLGPNGRIPIVLADEYTCLRAVASAANASGDTVELVLPAAGSRDWKLRVRADEKHIFPPTHHLCIAMDQREREKDFGDLIGRQYESFLSSSAHLVVGQLLRLERALKEELRAAETVVPRDCFNVDAWTRETIPSANIEAHYWPWRLALAELASTRPPESRSSD